MELKNIQNKNLIFKFISFVIALFCGSHTILSFVPICSCVFYRLKCRHDVLVNAAPLPFAIAVLIYYIIFFYYSFIFVISDKIIIYKTPGTRFQAQNSGFTFSNMQGDFVRAYFIIYVFHFRATQEKNEKAEMFRLLNFRVIRVCLALSSILNQLEPHPLLGISQWPHADRAQSACGNGRKATDIQNKPYHGISPF